MFRFINGLFKKVEKATLSEREQELLAKRYPNAQEADEWMSVKAAEWARKRPNNLGMLFSPTTADYLPVCVHVGSSWTAARQEHYRKLKAQYPQGVEQARALTLGLPGQLSLSRIGDDQDYHGRTLSSLR